MPKPGEGQVSGIFYVADVTGQVEGVDGETGRIADIKKGDHFVGRGSRIFAHDNASAVLLFSNQTTVSVLANTQLRVEKFDQEPFQPNNNLLIEPSNSTLVVYVEDGTVAINTAQLLTGTRMVFETEHCACTILNNQPGGQKAYLETDDKRTHFAMISGEARVNVRDKDGKLVFLGSLVPTNHDAVVRPSLGSSDDAKDGSNTTSIAINNGVTNLKAPTAGPAGTASGNNHAVALGQFYVVGTAGTVEYDIAGKPAPLQAGASVVANGTAIKTGKDGKTNLLFANQTVLALGNNTEIDVQQFQQEPFTPGGTPEGIEPSNSQSVFVLRSGAVDVDTPQLLAGTHLTFQTVHGFIGIMNGQSGGQKASINVDDKRTDVIMTEGLANVHPREADGSIGPVFPLTTGQEALVRPTVGAKPTLTAKTGNEDATPTVARGQFYVRRISGPAEMIAGGAATPLKAGDAYPAEAAVVKTAPGAKVTLLFSNHTSLSLEEKTELRVDQYQQEPFTVANDSQVEPSNSRSHLTLRSGQMDIDTPQLATGTHLVFETPHASISLLNVESGGEKASIGLSPKATDFQLILGRANVKQRGQDGTFVSAGQDLRTGQEAIVKPTLTGKATDVAVAGSAIANANATEVTLDAVPVAPAGAVPEDRPAQAKVLKVTGPAKVQVSATSASVDLAVGAELPEGALIETLGDSEVFVEPFVGAVADIRPNTQVVLEKLQVTMAGTVLMKRTSILNLKKGTIVSLIDPAGHNINDYAVRTPKGLAQAHGTSFAITVGDDSMSVTATADSVTFVTPTGTSYSVSAGNVTITPPGGEPQPPVTLSQAVAANPAFGGVVQTAMNTVSNIVQNNIGTMPSTSAANLISQVVGVASAALPAQAANFTTQAITAVSAPTSSTGGNAAAAVGAVTAAIVTSAPTQSSAIAVAASNAAPAYTVAAVASAAQAAPAQAALMAAAVVQADSQANNAGGGRNSAATAATVAAAATAGAPAQAAAIAGTVMQTYVQNNTGQTAAAVTQAATMLASAVTSSAPTQANPVATAVLNAANQGGTTRRRHRGHHPAFLGDHRRCHPGCAESEFDHHALAEHDRRESTGRDRFHRRNLLDRRHRFDRR